MVKKIFLFLLLAFFFASAQSYAENMAICTMEAKLCPDGVSYVGRTGPNCEFASCPVTSEDPPKICTQEYAPVCGKTSPKTCTGPGCASEYRTYSNRCLLDGDNATFISEGECTQGKDYPLLNEGLKTKIDNVIGDLIQKVEKKYTVLSDRNDIIYTIIDTLNTKKTKSQMVQQAIDYIVYKLSQYIKDPFLGN